MIILRGDLRMNCLPFTQGYQSPLRVLSVGMVQLRGINTKQTYLGLLDYQGVTINHIGGSPYHGLDGKRACAFLLERRESAVSGFFVGAFTA